MPNNSPDTTLLLQRSEQGHTADRDELLEQVYSELRGIASRYIANEKPGQTLQPTALVHEAYIRLIDASRIDWAGATHFRAISAKVMRQVLVDRARSRGAIKRGGDRQRVELDETIATPDGEILDLRALEDALQRLEYRDPRQATIVTMRYFAGMQMQEIATALGLAERTTRASWSAARAWLRRELADPNETDDD